MFASKLYHRSRQRSAGEQVRCKELPLTIKPAHTTRWMHKSQTCSPSKVQGAYRVFSTHRRHMHRCQPPRGRMLTPPCSRAPQSPKLPAASLNAARPRQPAGALTQLGSHHLPSQQNQSTAPAATLRAQPRAPPTKEFLAGMLRQPLLTPHMHIPCSSGGRPLSAPSRHGAAVRPGPLRRGRRTALPTRPSTGDSAHRAGGRAR